MKKIYKNLIGIGLISLLGVGLSIPAYAQRGGEHSQGGNSSGGNNGGGGSTPPPAAPQMSRPAPQQQSQPQMQRSQQPQQQSMPQMQRSAQSNGYGGQRSNGIPPATNQPRGAQHQQMPVFSQGGQGQGQGARRYPTIGSGRPTYGYGSPYRNGYRSYPGLRFGRNYVSPSPSGFYYRNQGYYRTYYTPRIGFSLSILPRGYYPFYYGPYQYYYSEGLYYRQMDDNSYTVVEPPVGATITRLPANAQSIVINGMQYYELNGVYYQPVTRDDGALVYQIAGKDGELNVDDGGGAPEDLPQVGDMVDSLPQGCRIIRLNGQKYYESQEGYYFQDAVDTNGDKVFIIVGTPEDQPGN